MQRTIRAYAFAARIAGLFFAIVGSQTMQAQQLAVPTPESVLGFTVGADYKLATYDESIRYFERLAAASNRIKLIDVGKTSTGHAWTLAVITSPENLAKLDRYREIAQRLAHPDGLTDEQARAGARRARVRGHQRRPPRLGDRGLAAHDPARVRHPRASGRPEDQGDPREHGSLALAIDQSRRPEHRRELVPRERRHAVRSLPAARALPEVHRPRQQSRRLHAQRRRVARRRAHVARVGAADHLRAAPDGAVPHAHLAAAVRRADRAARDRADVARGEHHRHDDRAGARDERAGGRDAHGHRLRRVVSRLHRLHADAPEHRVVLDGDRALPVRDAALLHDPRFPPRVSGPPAAVALREPVAGWLVAPQGRRGLHADGVDGGARLRDEVPRRTALEPLSGRTQRDQQVPPRPAVRVSRSAAAARSRRRGGNAAPPRVQRRAREPARQRSQSTTACDIRPARG